MTLPLSSAGFLSPSLGPRGDGDGPAFELKFLLDEAQAHEVEDWARRRLLLDPHGDPELDGAYRTTSLYCDTAELDVYRRTPGHRRRKFRVRRYGVAGWVYLERKAKRGDRVTKRRVAVAEEELPLLEQTLCLADWPGRWFQQRLHRRRLRPACLIRYRRTAYVGTCPEGPLRLTLDRRVRGQLTNAWSVAPFEGGLPLLTGQVIVEFKFRAALPAPFRELVAELRLNPAAVSKYRLCREACGVAASLGEVRDA